METIVEQVRKVDAETIQSPILRNLVVEVQTKSPDRIYAENRDWTDSKWSQWKQHSSYNPW
jgi:hypothetical protein